MLTIGNSDPAIWFPDILTGTGTDMFTERLAAALDRRGYRTRIGWLPHRAEFAPWSASVPEPPSWANVVHANSWLSTRFVPHGMPTVATIHLCVHDAGAAAYRGFAQRVYHRALLHRREPRLLRRANIVTAVSSLTARQAAIAFPGLSPRIVHNGLPAGNAWRQPRGPRLPGPFRLLYCGNWSARKGVDLLEPLLRALGDGFELLYTPDRDGGT